MREKISKRENVRKFVYGCLMFILDVSINTIVSNFSMCLYLVNYSILLNLHFGSSFFLQLNQTNSYSKLQQLPTDNLSNKTHYTLLFFSLSHSI